MNPPNERAPRRTNRGAEHSTNAGDFTIAPAGDVERQRAALAAALRGAEETLRLSEQPPAFVARMDQVMAGARDRAVSQSLAFRAARPDMAEYVPSPSQRIGHLAAVLVAASVRNVARCPHVTSDVPTTLNLTVRRWFCDDCGVSLGRHGDVVVITDDGRCDLCDEPPADGRFRPFLHPLGLITASGAVGSCCYAALNLGGAA